jgi:hypothetical protein
MRNRWALATTEQLQAPSSDNGGALGRRRRLQPAAGAKGRPRRRKWFRRQGAAFRPRSMAALEDWTSRGSPASRSRRGCRPTPSPDLLRAESESVAGECFCHLSAVGPDYRCGDTAIVPIRLRARRSALSVSPKSERRRESRSSPVRVSTRGACSWANAQAARPAPEARSAPPDSRDRGSADGSRSGFCVAWEAAARVVR